MKQSQTHDEEGGFGTGHIEGKKEGINELCIGRAYVKLWQNGNESDDKNSNIIKSNKG